MNDVQGTFEEAEASFRSQIKILEEEVTRQKVCNGSITYSSCNASDHASIFDFAAPDE
jgi:hypothetical protein